jgi:branched-chain amino acid transport system substrate-binding protein
MGESTEPTQRRGGWRRRGLAIAALSVLLVSLASCGDDDDGDTSSSDEPESTVDAAALLGPENKATGEPVKVGMVSDGATDAFDNRDELRAAEATAEYFNEHQGGIGGRPVEVVTCETGADPAGATDCANQFVEAGVVAVALSQSAVADSVWEPLHEAGVPTMWFQTSGQGIMADTESSFVLVNPLTTLFGLPISVAEQEGSDKVEFVIIDVPQARTGVEALGPTVMGKADLDFDVVPIAPGTADMTSQMQQVAASGAGVVHITGNDAFCIAALNGLNAVGYDGAIAVVSQCITDATREAVPGEVLDGVYVTATQALGAADDPTWQLYEAVMATYGDDVEDVNNNTAMGGYAAMASLLTSLQGITGDITPESVVATIKAMPQQELPGGGGVNYQCGGSALAMLPAVCSNEWLQTTLDGEGNPTTYEAVDSTDILP